MARPLTKEEMYEEAMGTKSTETRPLWAVAAEEWDPIKKEWGLVIRYNHANCEAQARTTYCMARQVPFRIIAAAQAIGFHVDDNQGLRLSA